MVWVSVLHSKIFGKVRKAAALSVQPKKAARGQEKKGEGRWRHLQEKRELEGPRAHALLFCFACIVRMLAYATQRMNFDVSEFFCKVSL